MPIPTHPTTSFRLKRTSEAGVLGTLFDLELGEDGGPLLVEGSKELQQSIALGLLMVRGEAWEAPRRGLPWHELVGMKPTNMEVVRFLILDELRADRRIRQVESLELTDDPARRGLTVRARVSGVSGEKVLVSL